MNWIETLYQTYESCSGRIGDAQEQEPLLPICHTPQNAHVEITLDPLGEFQAASVIEKARQKTVVPCTEASGGRSGKKPATHPLCDKLQYVAGDFSKFGGKVTSGFSSNPVEPHQHYLALLSAWCESPQGHPRVRSVLRYIKTGHVIRDLAEARVLHLDSAGKSLLAEWTRDDDPPPIFAALPGGTSQWDAFVRWAIEEPGNPEVRLWADPSVWESWSTYYTSSIVETGLCQVTGLQVSLAKQHPAKLRHGADKAKLISSNDSSGYTFRGRFTDPDGDQACGVGFDVTQKAHNALRWLIARQGRRDGGQAVVAWAVSGHEIPQIVDASDSLFDEDDSKQESESTAGNEAIDVGQDYALRLKKKIGGYRAELGDTNDIVVLAMDSATRGRMAITYSREIASSEFLDSLESWHLTCSWHQNFGKDRKFVGAPAPRDIAKCAFGRRLDDKLLASTHRRLLPCILDARPIPDDLVRSCLHRAEARSGQDRWDWEKSLGIACALFRKQQINNHQYSMALERDRTSRNYLYGRLLAVADHLESMALEKDEERESNAARLTLRFADHPFSTWRKIEPALTPYRRRLKANKPWWLARYDKELDEIMNLFQPDEFNADDKLSGEFLLAFHCQRSALWQKWDKHDEDESPEEN